MKATSSASAVCFTRMVRMADGTRLATDVAVPDTSQRWPVLLLRTPYSRSAIDVGAYTSLGWAVVAQDSRGRFDSSGTFEPFHVERADGAETVEWCAAQPWSSGRVAMWQPSYNGATQLLAAMETPPALRAIAPGMTPSDYEDGWVFEGGAVMQGFVQSWCHTMGGGDPGEATDPSFWVELFARPLGACGIESQLDWYRRWLEAGRDYWDPVSPRSAYERMDVAAYHVAGWFDLFCEGTLENYVGLRRRAATARARRDQYLVIGPWTHMAPYASVAGDIDFGPGATGGGVADHQLQWLREAVDEVPVEAGVRAFDTGAREWVRLASWPPAAGDVVFHLGADRSLVRHEAPARGALRYRHDPSDPVPTVGGRGSGHPVAAGMFEQSAVEARDDVLVFTSAPLSSPLTVGGPVTAGITFSSSGRSADVVVRLCDVHPDGSSFNVVDSVRRARVIPGVAQRVDVRVGSCLHTFRPGHRVRVQVASSNFPRLDRNPSTSVPVGQARQFRSATQTVHTGAADGSMISLPAPRSRAGVREGRDVDVDH